MTIKQQGGIFGRNPTFNDVEVEGNLSVPNDSISGDAIDGGTITPTEIRTASVKSATGNNGLTIADAGYSAFFGASAADALCVKGNSNSQLEVGGGAGGFDIRMLAYDRVNPGYKSAYFHTSNFGWYIGSSGKVAEITAGGNLWFKNGNGIDFSATAGTGTSELFDDYEEGEYTATLTCGTSGTVTLQSAANTLQYTKTGRMCHVTGQVRVDSISSPVGYLQLNLPFTNSNLTGESDRTTGVVLPQNTSAANVSDFALWIGAGASVATIVLGDATTGQYDTAEEMTASTQIYFNFSYIPA